MRMFLLMVMLLLATMAFSQTKTNGSVTGNLLDEKSKALAGATAQFVLMSDTSQTIFDVTDNNGAFSFSNLAFGFYKLRISFVGFTTVSIDSIHLRTERSDFNLNDIVLKPAAGNAMDEVIIYLEKPLIQSKDGNITFNAGESALSAGSNAGDLLNNVPLITKDPTGKILVRGKEPKILIDDKPVELNQQQLQDLLESMSGSTIEKIEVMTNPPAQYAGEQGGVINIVTKKGTVGKTGRLTISGGTRGELSANGSFNYRRQGLTISANAGLGYNNFDGAGYSKRTNADSMRYNNNNRYQNENLRPNFRTDINYDINKHHALNLLLQYNSNNFENHSITEYQNRNKLDSITYYSERSIKSTGSGYNPNATVTYTLRTKKAGEVFRLIANANNSSNSNQRNFYELYFDDERKPTGEDTTQQQLTKTKNEGYNFRMSYDVPLANKKTFLSAGGFYNLSRSEIDAAASYVRRADKVWVPLDALTNHFIFRQQIANMRASVKQILSEGFSFTGGAAAEATNIAFDLFQNQPDTTNSYWRFLPFANVNRNWKDKLNLTFSYRRTIRRPGIGELNPTVDFSDRYTNRFGNPGLKPSLAHNLDLVLGKTKKAAYFNLGFGYNIVEDIFNQVRTLVPGGKTEITWQNISGRKECEVSTWNGYTFSRQFKLSLSASYTHNVYGEFEKVVRKFRDGGTLTSNLNLNYSIKDLYNATGSFTFNRFANPQGTVRSSLSMNIALQARMMKKKIIATLNLIDPFLQQQNRTLTYGVNFVQENFNQTQTRNFRLSVAYVFSGSGGRK